MTATGRAAVSRRPMARRVGPSAAERIARAESRPETSSGGRSEGTVRSLRSVFGTGPKRIALIAGATILGGVAIVGAFAPATAAGGSGSAHGAAPAAAAGASIVGADWGATGGFDVMDLITKGGLVLVLLFITLRVLGRMQSAAPKRGLQLQVLESRTLAAKASLHLVAVGERRLVVGLTPSGMVSLVELDAAELEAPETEARTAADSTASAKLTPQLAGPIGALMAPIDGFTDRLAGFFNSGRTR